MSPSRSQVGTRMMAASLATKQAGVEDGSSQCSRKSLRAVSWPHLDEVGAVELGSAEVAAAGEKRQRCM